MPYRLGESRWRPQVARTPRCGARQVQRHRVRLDNSYRYHWSSCDRHMQPRMTNPYRQRQVHLASTSRAMTKPEWRLGRAEGAPLFDRRYDYAWVWAALWRSIRIQELSALQLDCVRMARPIID